MSSRSRKARSKAKADREGKTSFKNTSSGSFGDGILSGGKTSPVGNADGSEKWNVPYPDGLPSDRPLDPDDYFEQLAIWLDLEGDAERARLARLRQIRSQRDVESTGQAIVGLDLVDYHTGLAGRYLLDLAKPGGKELPMNRLKVGSPVVLSMDDDPSDEGIAGVVSRRKNHSIQIATEVFPDRDRTEGSGGKSGKRPSASLASDRFRLDLSPDETTRQRQLAAMGKAQNARGRSGKLRDVLLGIKTPRVDGNPIDTHEIDPESFAFELNDIEFRTELNPPQRDAVAFALMADDVAIIHGPPGTGKTTTISEIIAQSVLRGERVLACAASNTAVDNLLERLVRLMPNVVRVGHPARVFESLQEHTLDALVESDPTNAVIKDLRRELDQILREANRPFRGDPGRQRRQRRELFAEAGRLRGLIRSQERSIVRSVIDRADVICTTTTIDEELLSDQSFDLVVIDESCQCTEPGMWQAILRADRLILAGDHCQLPPTVLSDEAARIGMRESLMQRLVQRHGQRIYRRLTVQYRMHESIMRFSSDHFYEGTLVADASVRSHRLCDLENVDDSDFTREPLLLIDTAGAGYEEELEPDGQSKLNHGEAKIILQLVKRLADAGVTGDQIAVIAPYAAQVRNLRMRLDLDGIEIDTVDGFQGREKEVVLITMTRCNPDGEIGFLSDRRRSNVALTRAKRKLIVVGDSATLCGHEFYSDLFGYFEEAGVYHSVFTLEGA
ncbi:AAA domain-containing protein [Rhodopirellula sp. JC740]|uniref:DNA helicase n=1 Tax=Rhodopirellula halodulae TaxID=2894198 RepID=A0ABS8NAX4_9BACT|nr:AAA domain-containing protein [Rhodopirellula sp. JC740]MCC9640726.1 AAA domain-containing protein [Rhodopirellula sp. JC740]